MKKPGFAILAISAAITVVAAWLWLQRPTHPSCVFPDGTTVEFLGYTHNQVHSNQFGPRWKEPLRKMLPLQYRHLLGSGFMSSRANAETNEYVAWLLATRTSLTNTRSSVYSPTILDSHGCAFQAQYFAPGASISGKKMLVSVPLTVFPRRDPEIVLQFANGDGSRVELRIPNPAGTNHPTWQATNAVQVTDAYTFKFRSWLLDGSPDVQMDVAGQLQTYKPRQLTLEDATGNSNARLLCLMEPVRIRDRIVTRQLKPEDMVVLRSLRVPATNEVQLLRQSFVRGTNHIGLYALAGAGKVELPIDGATVALTNSVATVLIDYVPGTTTERMAVWVNNRLRSALSTHVAANGSRIVSYSIEVPTTFVTVEVAPDPCIELNMIVPPAGDAFKPLR